MNQWYAQYVEVAHVKKNRLTRMLVECWQMKSETKMDGCTIIAINITQLVVSYHRQFNILKQINVNICNDYLKTYYSSNNSSSSILKFNIGSRSCDYLISKYRTREERSIIFICTG